MAGGTEAARQGAADVACTDDSDLHFCSLGCCDELSISAVY
jgi:hypothetical protein